MNSTTLAVIAAGVVAYLYFSNSTATAAATVAAAVPQGIAVGEHNPTTPIEVNYGGDGGGGSGGTLAPLGFGGPRLYQWNYGAVNPFDDPWFNGPTYAEQYPIAPGVISAA